MYNKLSIFQIFWLSASTVQIILGKYVCNILYKYIITIILIVFHSLTLTKSSDETHLDKNVQERPERKYNFFKCYIFSVQNMFINKMIRWCDVR